MLFIKNLKKAIKETKETKKREKNLKRCYEIVDAMVEEHTELENVMKDLSVSSIEELIQKYPAEAYINGVIYDFKEKNEEEAKKLTEEFITKQTESIKYVIDEIKSYKGSTKKVKTLLTKICNLTVNKEAA